MITSEQTARGAGSRTRSEDREAQHFTLTLDSPFTLAGANTHFGGWPAVPGAPEASGLAFPLEGWRTSAAVLVRQVDPTTVTGTVYGAGAEAARAWAQALAVLSLDVPAAGWAEVGARDPVIGRLQVRYDGLRPVLFHSPYEAAAAFIIGHRISIAQGRAIRQALARAHGDAVPVGGTALPAFPQPSALLGLSAFPGISAEKVRRLHAVAEAALDGLLDRAALRARPIPEALTALQTLPGIGPFFGQGILIRGAGLVDTVADDEVTQQAVQQAYDLPALPAHTAVLERAEVWRPYRTWATVLLHVWLRREGGGPQRPPRA